LDTPTLSSRRAFLKGAVPAVAATALAIPAVAVAAEAETEHPWITARRLARELSQALADIETNPVAPGSSVAVVFPKGHPHGIGFVDLDWYLESFKGPTAGMTAEQRRDYHLAEFKKACEELDPMIGHWSELHRDEDDGRLSLHAFRVTGRYEGDGIYEDGRRNLFGKRGKWSVVLQADTIDGERCFEVRCPGDWMVLTEPALQTFIGRRLA